MYLAAINTKEKQEEFYIIDQGNTMPWIQLHSQYTQLQVW